MELLGILTECGRSLRALLLAPPPSPVVVLLVAPLVLVAAAPLNENCPGPRVAPAANLSNDACEAACTLRLAVRARSALAALTAFWSTTRALRTT